VFDNTEKGAMVHRLMVGLGAAGVERVLMMPAGSGLSESLRRILASHPAPGRPELELLDMPVRGTAEDTVVAVERLLEREVDAIAVLGGDGTHRLVARHCGTIPLCGLSTGTNNAFPAMREATVAGIAAGLVATGRATAAVRREKILRVGVRGDPDADCALVDCARTTERWVGARALWRPEDVAEAVVAFGEPGSVGLSALAGLADPVPRAAPYGLHVVLGDPASAPSALRVPFAPGLVVPVGILSSRRVEPGETIELGRGTGCLALDGERELELGPGDRVQVTLALDGPYVVDVDAAMAEAARRGLLAAGGGT
jgi:predicted polyphosphate/ATP-dependent NAD kinase